MLGWTAKQKLRRKQVREKRAKASGDLRVHLAQKMISWPVLVGITFVMFTVLIARTGEFKLAYTEGQNLPQPIYAKVAFKILDEGRTRQAREAAEAATPSHYVLKALTYDRIRADLHQIYRAAAESDTFEDYAKSVSELEWPAVAAAYERLRTLVSIANEGGQKQYQQWVDSFPLEREYVIPNLTQEPQRKTKSTTDYIILEMPDGNGNTISKEIKHSSLVSQSSDKALSGSAAEVARKFSAPELRSTVEAVALARFRTQPTIIFDKDRTAEELRKAADAAEPVMTAYEKGQVLVTPGVMGSDAYALLRAHHHAVQDFLKSNLQGAPALRRELALQQAGGALLLILLTAGLLTYTAMHHRRIFEVQTGTLAFGLLILGTFLSSRLMVLYWPHIPELVFGPCLLTATILAIIYPHRFALGAMCLVSVIITVVVRNDLMILLALLIAVAICIYLLDEIRSRTKLITSGGITAFITMLASAAGGFFMGHAPEYVLEHALWAGGVALAAAFVASGVLPFVERVFRIATSLTLLEWRDPTKKLLQLLARQAPGTYNHSLVMGTLAEAACQTIHAHGLLAQVGCLYHDIGKIHKAEYFTENQEGSFNRHDNLAPTMSLLIILGHVKDGAEMAKEYKLPRVLHQFIEEHHGTTVVRYFHHVASERQPQIASGKHDREVSEAEFRYGGPKPRSKESAVVMMCDGVESAVRALHEPTVGRIEGIVHQIIMDRLNDGQFDDCEITLREIRQVRDSLVKSLCSIYHGRLAYPKAKKDREESARKEKVSV